ncbi:MAG: nucleotidyltransferase family protein [Pseudomonas marincola]
MENKISSAMILAAGLGRRLRPLTDTTPKPLIKVAGKALIDYSFDLLRGAGISKAVVNCHYLADQIEAHVETVTDLEITVSDERGALLETGGGVQKALPLLGSGPFAVLNSDVIIRDGHDTSLKAAVDYWDPKTMDVLLLLQPKETAVGYDGSGDYQMSETGELSRCAAGGEAPFIFSGIQIINPELFMNIEPGKFSMNVIFDKAQAQGRLFGLRHPGQWLHAGTEAALNIIEKKIREL